MNKSKLKSKIEELETEEREGADRPSVREEVGSCAVSMTEGAETVEDLPIEGEPSIYKYIHLIKISMEERTEER